MAITINKPTENEKVLKRSRLIPARVLNNELPRGSDV